MDIGLGMHVRTSDDKDLGTVDRLIVDPATRRVKAAVIRKGLFLPRDVELPLDEMLPGPDGHVRVNRTADVVGSMPEFHPDAYTIPPGDFSPPSSYPLGAFAWPFNTSLVGEALPAMPLAPIDDPMVEAEARAALRREDLENAVIAEGSEVRGRDGTTIGHVHELSFDSQTGKLAHFVVRKGLLLRTDTTLPATLIAGAGDGVLTLSVDADDLTPE